MRGPEGTCVSSSSSGCRTILGLSVRPLLLFVGAGRGGSTTGLLSVRIILRTRYLHRSPSRETNFLSVISVVVVPWRKERKHGQSCSISLVQNS